MRVGSPASSASALNSRNNLQVYWTFPSWGPPHVTRTLRPVETAQSTVRDVVDWIVLIVILVLVFMLSTLPIDIVMFVVGLIYTTKLEHQKALMDYKSNPKKDDEEADKSKE